MKTLVTLWVAFMATCFSFAQSPVGIPVSSSVSPHPLSHEDSLVLAEVAPGARDTLAQQDSLSGTRPRILPFQSVVNAVLQDFPHNLRHITGDLVLAQGEFENYASTVVLAGAEDNCIITRYHSADDTTASWQAKMLTTGEFERAAQEYHELYKKLQRCYVRLVDGSVIYLDGTWEPAKESVRFTTSTLRLLTGDWRYRDVKVELELVYLLADWAVNINIVSKKRDNEVGGGFSPTP